MAREKKHGGHSGERKQDKYHGTDGNCRASLHFARPFFVEGEEVEGYVEMECKTPCEGAIVLKAQGYETAKWTLKRLERNENDEPITIEEEYDGSRDFFKMKLQIFQGTVEAGTHKFPFKFTLPADLTGTFCLKSGQGFEPLKGKVQYKIKAKCSWSRELSCKKKFIIREKPDRIAEQLFVEHEGNVNLLCCIPRGKVLMRAKFDKNAYEPGQTANIIVECQNQSGSNVDNLVMKLMQILTLTSEDGRKLSKTSTVAEATFDGVPAGEEVKGRECPLPIPADCHTTTNGKHVQCAYRLDVESQIPWAVDVEIQIPIFIYCAPGSTD